MSKDVFFNEIFEQWAEDYDATVAGGDQEYREVFEGYPQILQAVADSLAFPKGSLVMEFGVGTGNLTSLLQKSVTG